jgi:hypothetical protein
MKIKIKRSMRTEIFNNIETPIGKRDFKVTYNDDGFVVCMLEILPFDLITTPSNLNLKEQENEKNN